MTNHKLVLKNTIFLYIRLIITVLVTLYTTRVVLNVLGVTDFGIYNVIGGVVAMLTFLTSTMSNASTRFFSFELGKGTAKSRLDTFKTTLTIYLLIVLGIIIVGETLGLWFIKNKLNLATDRYVAAHYVYQFSLLSLILNIIRIPFNALIIAHERMNFYAYISIVESVLKLGIVYLLIISPWDKLAFYSILVASVVGIITFIYYIYSTRHFHECKIGIIYSPSKFKEILCFSSWNLFSNFGDVMMDQGLNIILNIFFGPVANAARGIAYNVKGVMMSFAGNFQSATSPQITKHYASTEYQDMHTLVVQSSRLTYYLILIIVVPSFFCMKKLLDIWLKNVPEYTYIFTLLLMIDVLILAMGGTLNNAIQATGRIKKFVISLSNIKLIMFGLVYLGFRFGHLLPQYAFYISILNSFCCMLCKFFFYSKVINISIRKIIHNIILREAIVTLLCVTLIFPFYIMFYDSDNLICVLIFTCATFITTLLSVLFIGLTSKERNKLKSFIKR